MKERGFTLIELLAVIVILAIIALIATPIVLNIIEDSKKSSFKQTGNGIVDAAEYYYMKEMSDGAKPTENKVFTFNGSTSGLEGLEFDGEIPKEGTLTVDVNGNIELVAHNNQYCLTKGYNENEITIKDYDGNCTISDEENSVNTLDTICTYDTTSTIAEKTAGAKYTCEVKEGTSYNFYVLTTPEEGAETINLIMDQNINSDGTPAGMTGVTQATNANQYNLVAWMSDSDYGCDGDDCATNDKGPVTGMTFLYNATKDWTNIDPVNYTYMDKETQGTTAENTSYISFVSTNGVATITSLTGDGVTIGTSDIPLRARMPIYSSDVSITEVPSAQNASYLYDNLYSPGSSDSSAPYGYWTISSMVNYSASAMNVYYSGFVPGNNVYDDIRGVRPVINLKI